ncbi:MAG: DUF1311 domain-containing protein [Xanthomonadales bacterium]|nr:DUF1311 domain-containing protein [Xanthomonadales bacterium]
MKSLVFTLVLMMCSGTASADIVCREKGSQMEVNRCAQDNYRKIESTLNDELDQFDVLLKEQPRELKLLRQSQSAWLGYVDAQMAFRFPTAEGADPIRYFGSMYWSEFYDAKSLYLQARIKELHQIRQMMPQWLEMRDVVDEAERQGARDE